MTPPKADILVIDDTPDNLTLLAAMLTDQGYKVRSVTKGATGLRGAQAMPPDLILLDINMPQMNGYEVCEQLKADDRTREIPVIFISALEDVLDKVKAFSIGAVDYITKPFQVEEVLARIEIHLTLRRLQQQLQTQNARLQKEIRERQKAEEKFVKAFRSSPHPIAIATLSDRRLLDVNPSFLRVSGYVLEDVIGHTIDELKLGFLLSDSTTVLQEQGSLYNQECEFRTKTGQTKTVLISIELIDLDGVPCTLNIINDITERKRLENEFISMVSHELRTPLTSVMGAMDLLGSGQLGSLTDRGLSVLNIAINNTERLIRLVNNILDLERMKSGKIFMQLLPHQAEQVLTQAADEMAALAHHAQIQLVVKPVKVELWIDGDRIVQTLTNLISNAVKFSEPGKTVQLSAQVVDPDQDEMPGINLPAMPMTPSLLIQVQDEGRGIPADKLHLIFERFQQVDASDSRQKGGSGLGLAICRNIVEQHGGMIWAESVSGKGSTFNILLPLKPLETENDP